MLLYLLLQKHLRCCSRRLDPTPSASACFDALTLNALDERHAKARAATEVHFDRQTWALLLSSPLLSDAFSPIRECWQASEVAAMERVVELSRLAAEAALQSDARLGYVAALVGNRALKVRSRRLQHLAHLLHRLSSRPLLLFF